MNLQTNAKPDGPRANTPLSRETSKAAVCAVSVSTPVAAITAANEPARSQASKAVQTRLKCSSKQLKRKAQAENATRLGQKKAVLVSVVRHGVQRKRHRL